MKRFLKLLVVLSVVVGTMVFAVPMTASTALACTPVWSQWSRKGTTVTVYDRNHSRSAVLEFDAISQISSTCPGGAIVRHVSVVQINDGTIFNATVAVWKTGLNPYLGDCEPSTSWGGSYNTASVSHVTYFALYGPQYLASSDQCWSKAADGGPQAGTYIQSLIASDGAPYFQPTYNPSATAMQNQFDTHGGYVAPDVSS